MAKAAFSSGHQSIKSLLKKAPQKHLLMFIPTKACSALDRSTQLQLAATRQGILQKLVTSMKK